MYRLTTKRSAKNESKKTRAREFFFQMHMTTHVLVHSALLILLRTWVDRCRGLWWTRV